MRADGAATFCPMQRSLLIVAGLNGAPRPRDELVLERGDSLVMYSDGLIERRGEIITDGMERLAGRATDIARSGWPDRPAATFASTPSVDERTDDLVVLCLHYAGVSEGRRTAAPLGTSRDGMSTLHLEPVVESTPLARNWVAAHLRDLPAEVSGYAAFLTSELVTNAVLHAATPMCVTLHILPDRIRIDVADGNPAFPSIKDYGQDAATGTWTHAVRHAGVELGRPSRRRWQDRLVRTAGGLSGPARSSLGRELPLRPHRHHALGNARRRLRVARGVGPAYRHPRHVAPEVKRGVRGALCELRLMKERSDSAPGAPALPERLAVLVSR